LAVRSISTPARYDSRRMACDGFGSRGEKDIERNTIVLLDFEKLHADIVFLHPLYGGKTHFYGRLVPRKIQHEREFLPTLEEMIDTEPGTFTGEIEEGSVLGVLCQQRDDRGLPGDGDTLGIATVGHRSGSPWDRVL